MCVIMSSGPGVPVPPNDHLIRANEENPHGWGVAINLPNACREHMTWGPFGADLRCTHCRHNSQIVVLRGFNSGDLLDAVEALDKMRTAASSLVVHCRIATGGTITLENTHPFDVTTKLHLFHNGIFSEASVPTVKDPLRPDSYHLAKLLEPCLAPAPAWLLAPVFTQWMDDLCKAGYPSKVLLLDAVCGNVLYNRDAWIEGGEGRLYSNEGPLFDPYDYQTDEDFWKEHPEWIDESEDGESWATWKDDIRRNETLIEDAEWEDLREEVAYAHKIEKRALRLCN